MTARLTIGILGSFQIFLQTIHDYHETILQGIYTAAREQNCNILVSGSLGHLHEQARNYIGWYERSDHSDFTPVGPYNCDGLILAGPFWEAAEVTAIQQLIDRNYPLAAISLDARYQHVPIAISPDNRAGIATAIQHLVAHGHREIAFLAGRDDPNDVDSQERLQVFYSTMQHLNLPVRSEWIAYSQHGYEDGLQAARQLLQAKPRFTALVASNDTAASAAIEVFCAAKLRIPHDIAIMSFDNQPVASVVKPGLTTLNLPLFDMGKLALEHLVKSIREGQPGQHVRVALPLVIRESCGCRDETIDLPLKQRIYTVLTSEMRHFSTQRLQQLAHNLIQAFQTPRTLEPMLLNMQEEVLAVGDNLNPLQLAVEILAEQFPMQPTQAALARRLLVNAAQKQHNRYKYEQHHLTNQLSNLAARLQTARTIEAILEELAADLHLLGIQWLLIGLFDNEQYAPNSLCDVFHLQYQRPMVRQRLPVQHFLQCFEKSALHLAVMPIVTPQTQIGFAVFDIINLPLCSSIVKLIAQALYNANLYQQAQEANRLKSRFLSMVSHELRTPLNIIVSLSELLLDHPPGGASEDLSNIHASAEHLRGLINDVLDLASSEAGKLRLAYQAVPLADLLTEIIPLAEFFTRQKNLHWHTDIPEHLPLIWADRTRLRQVILNLIMNATKFTEAGSVTLQVRTNGQQVQVAVQDTGLGIPPPEQALIFDEFRQAASTSTRAYGGLGLGLAICRRLIELHGGEIQVTSSGEPGAGSTFTFTLPIYTPASHPEIRTDSVLVVGKVDIPLKATLDQLGVETVFTTPQALESMLATGQPGVVVLPADMPDYWEMLRFIRDNPRTAHVPVMLHDNTRLLEVDYLPKPLDDRTMITLLERQPLAAHPNPKILIVDDEPITLDLHSRLVRTWLPGAEILRANGGQAALGYLQQVRPDLVLLDLMMPEIDGFAVLEWLRQHETTRDVAVVILTAQMLAEEDIQRLSQGFTTILSKGIFSVEETVEHLQAALTRSVRVHSPAHQLVQKALGYIHTHYHEGLSRDTLARHLNVNEDYLTRCFTQAMGISPITYLNRYRIQHARVLLETSSYSISEIAYQMGFGDYTNFSRAFRKQMGISPSEYRQGTG